MMVYFRKQLPETVVNDCNERIARYGLMGTMKNCLLR